MDSESGLKAVQEALDAIQTAIEAKGGKFHTKEAVRFFVIWFLSGRFWLEVDLPLKY